MNAVSELKHVMPFLIPIIAIIMGIGLAMMGLWADHQRKARLLEAAHAERMRALEQGRDLPSLPEGLLGTARQGRATEPAEQLRRGLMWLLVGAALGIALWVNKGPERATFALIPAAVGLAYLLALRLAPAPR